ADRDDLARVVETLAGDHPRRDAEAALAVPAIAAVLARLPPAPPPRQERDDHAAEPNRNGGSAFDDREGDLGEDAVAVVAHQPRAAATRRDTLAPAAAA